MDQPGTHMQSQKSMHPRDLTPAKELSEEEQLVLRECQKESTMFRAFPLAAFSGITTYFSINNIGLMKPHPTYGASPKVVAAVALGYIIGKMSYFGACQNKILSEVPHSNLAAAVRRARGIPPIAPREEDSGASGVSYSEMENDEPSAPEQESLPVASIRSYDDRRLLNRRMYEAHQHLGPPQPLRPPPARMESSVSSPPPPVSGGPKPSMNKYGDEGFE